MLIRARLFYLAALFYNVRRPRRNNFSPILEKMGEIKEGALFQLCLETNQTTMSEIKTVAATKSADNDKICH
jgi:hypothetical protein